MKRLGLSLVVLCTLLAALGTHAAEERTYYYQMICGSDRDLSRKPGAKPIGLKLRTQLETPFKWKHWAELSHGTCLLPPEHGVAIAKLADNRELRIHRDGSQLHVELLRNGQLVRTQRTDANIQSLIMGGDQGRDGCWFVVLRNDRPSTMTVVADKN